ncbi:YybH family protein [Cupriavidus basilensis]|uniref:YybH family protein n=1 Tax=Cupriavidus basilensis TaxID=68895 RepID=UPI0023E88525|nr:SgcJ/EcaC family oxidoreductase [Cupriavidus basilensis]MDF3887058.1 SgcJ/EcaC family oxidoreductase [Cupriavidus basilensis]
MRNIFRVPLAAVAASMLLQPAAQGATPAWDAAVSTAISGQLARYEQALNSADIDRIMSLYARDPVFMPQNGSPAVGREAVRRAYGHVFDSIKLNVRFEVDEIRLLSDEWAYARTRSRGTVTRLGNAVPPGPEANQELFLLRREADGQWRFARYIFSTTNPPAQPD